jgi:hypothetical protein
MVRKKIMEGGDKVAAASNPKKVALWVKEAMDRLDAVVPPEKRGQIMTACGHNCIAINQQPLKVARARRQKYPSEEDFLKTEVEKPPRGFRFEREGDVLIQYYTPRAFGRGMRCYCSLVRGLPEGVVTSPTYCQCSRGFVEKYWEGILGRAVRVELGATAITGADECQFTIHL